MREVIGPGTVLGYCTNVHAGTNLQQIKDNLDRYAVKIKSQVSPSEPMGVGLWLAASTVRQLSDQNRVDELAAFLDSRGLLAYTFNGFPFNNFHAEVVKHRVYEPDWTDPSRFAYTLDLARILARLIPEDSDGSISTLPIGWPAQPRNEQGQISAADEYRLSAAARNLTSLVHQLARLELDTGRHIHIDLEPEPGCLLQTSSDVVEFFQNHLLGTADDRSVLDYLRICHDTCHAAVMFESQKQVIESYRSAGIKVGKVQLSSAISIDWSVDKSEIQRQFDAISRFDETRFLHQVNVIRKSGGNTLYEDLPIALQNKPETYDRWRVHFHVPVHLDTLGELGTTQADIVDLLNLQPQVDCQHFEIETYAWDVLPDSYRVDDLADGIAEEFRFAQGLITS
jgi:hypothetical protein